VPVESSSFSKNCPNCGRLISDRLQEAKVMERASQQREWALGGKQFILGWLLLFAAALVTGFCFLISSGQTLLIWTGLIGIALGIVIQGFQRMRDKKPPQERDREMER
jgi:hypothetical protein